MRQPGAGKQKENKIDVNLTSDQGVENRISAIKQSAGHRQKTSKSALSPLFLYIEAGNFRRAIERAKRYPKEVRTWTSVKFKPSSSTISSTVGVQPQLSTAKRLALHQACFKLRATSASSVKCRKKNLVEEDTFVEACRFILLLIDIYPDACGMRETRHGCLPLHLAAFASGVRPFSKSRGTTVPNFEESNSTSNDNDADVTSDLSLVNSNILTSSLSSTLPCSTIGKTETSSATLLKPKTISENHRDVSESTIDTMRTTMSAAIAEEKFVGIQSEYQNEHNQQQYGQLCSTTEPTDISQAPGPQKEQIQSVSMGHNILISEKREECVVRVLNALLDAYPRGIRMDSEGGRLPLHHGAAGRATPRAMATLITAYPAAARHRNKDGYLPLHLCAHWGIAHPNVVVNLLRHYADATFGRNRWERTPLEEALCMAGENGRPHQAALVRALRKHPSYWTRPEGILFHQTDCTLSLSRDTEHCIVDTDETLASA